MGGSDTHWINFHNLIRKKKRMAIWKICIKRVLKTKAEVIKIGSLVRSAEIHILTSHFLEQLWPF